MLFSLKSLSNEPRDLTEQLYMSHIVNAYSSISQYLSIQMLGRSRDDRGHRLGS